MTEPNMLQNNYLILKSNALTKISMESSNSE